MIKNYLTIQFNNFRNSEAMKWMLNISSYGKLELLGKELPPISFDYELNMIDWCNECGFRLVCIRDTPHRSIAYFDIEVLKSNTGKVYTNRG